MAAGGTEILKSTDDMSPEDAPIVPRPNMTDEPDDSDPKDEGYDENAAPLHLHPMKRGSARLTSLASTGKTGSARNLRRSSSRSRSRSRSGSPSPATVSTSLSCLEIMDDSSASFHSLMGDDSAGISPIPPDILTDRMGIEELEPLQPHAPTHTLTLVHERMSEETMEDTHAFCDLAVPKRNSARMLASDGSLGGDNPSCNNSVLGILEEADDSESDEDEPQKIDKKVLAQEVIFQLEKVEESAGREGGEETGKDSNL